jgi:hypothetical protein
MSAIQKVRFPILFLLKGFCIELASMGSVSTYIHHQITVTVTTSGDVNRQLWFQDGDRTERVDKRRSAFCHSFFMSKKVPPVEIHRELVTMYGAIVMTVQHVHKWRRELRQWSSECDGWTKEWSAVHVC